MVQFVFIYGDKRGLACVTETDFVWKDGRKVEWMYNLFIIIYMYTTYTSKGGAD